MNDSILMITLFVWLLDGRLPDWRTPAPEDPHEEA